MATATPRISGAAFAGTRQQRRFTLGKRIAFIFGALFVLMLVMAAISYTRLRVIDEEATSIAQDSAAGLYFAAALREASGNAYTTLERALFVDNGDTASVARDIGEATEALRRIEQISTEYQGTISRGDDRARFHAFRAAWDQFLPSFNDALRNAQSSREAAQITFLRLRPAWEAVARGTNSLVEENHGQADESATQIRQTVNGTEITLAAALTVVLLVALVTGYALHRAITVPMARLLQVLDRMRTGNLTERLDLGRRDEFGSLEEGFNRMMEELANLVAQAQKSSLQVTTSVTEIAATSKEQQATASETAATTNEIGATSREILATSRDLLHTMNEVSSVAEQSATLAGASRSGLAQMEDTMHGVMQAAGSVNAKLAILNEKAANINQVVATITKVADQTNLLSLNAAIEAEKAGEYGRGFAVVATEIRRLADQTAVATYDIEQTVKEIQSAVSAGVMGMDRFSEEVRRGMHDVQQVGTQLSQIITEVQALAPRFQLVNEGMQTQASGAEQITQALTQLSEAAQQTAESLRQSSQAIDDLTLVANQLRSGVSRFRIEQ
jgi:methyl-accepting chemotaxis protein WspA